MSQTETERTGDLVPDSEAVSATQSRSERDDERRQDRETKTNPKVNNPNQASEIGRFVTSHYLTFSIAFSLLLIVGGALLVISSLPASIFPLSARDVVASTLPKAGGVVFVVIGVLLLISPLFFNRFVFDAIDYERALRIRAQKSTREAQLLQDILTHDVRNYNQVSKLSAELLAEEFKDNDSAKSLVVRLLDSIDGSTLLVERAKMLGRVISEESALDRRPINVLQSIKRSMSLISASNPEKKITAVVKLGGNALAPLETLDVDSQTIDVSADDLIDEVFANLFSNSIKYTEGDVFIGIEISKEYVKEVKKDCWKISISDTGKGIPDYLKDSLFSRYLEGAKGSGLGMSIVHALVVGCYGGKIQIANRVEKDHTKGTVIELFLPASAGAQ
jgi:signal transduction histidine kinase